MATNTSMQRQVGSYVKLVAGLLPTRLLAGAGTDNVDQNGPLIDRDGYLSALVGLNVSATLATGQSISVTVRVQDTSDSTGATGWNDFLGDDAAVPAAVVLLAANAAAGQLQLLKVNLSNAKRYIRVVGKGDLSAGSVDLATIAAAVVLGGAHVLPAV